MAYIYSNMVFNFKEMSINIPSFSIVIVIETAYGNTVSSLV